MSVRTVALLIVGEVAVKDSVHCLGTCAWRIDMGQPSYKSDL
jgi:hypothetical protein